MHTCLDFVHSDCLVSAFLIRTARSHCVQRAGRPLSPASSGPCLSPRPPPGPAAGQQPAASSQQPAASSQQPEASSQQPAASSQQPAARSQQPAASSQQPAASSQQPEASSQQPAASSQQPAASSQQRAADRPGAARPFPPARIQSAAPPARSQQATRSKIFLSSWSSNAEREPGAPTT